MGLPRPSRCGAIVWERAHSTWVLVPTPLDVVLTFLVMLIFALMPVFWRFYPTSGYGAAIAAMAYILFEATVIRLTPTQITFTQHFRRKRIATNAGRFVDASETSDLWDVTEKEFGRVEQLFNNEIRCATVDAEFSFSCARPKALLKKLANEQARVCGLPQAREI